MFQSLEQLPADPILGLMAAHKSDCNPNKIDLGVGVYKDEESNTPIMQAVKEAEEKIWLEESSKSYIGPAGAEQYNQLIQALLFGPEHPSRSSGRICTVQTPGGCGALRLGAEFINKTKPAATIWVSDPTWANHTPLLGSAGLQLKYYPYYDYAAHSLRFDDMMTSLKQTKPGDLVLLHGCCHNPCGADLDHSQWQAVSELAQQQGFTPFIDIAYQGLGSGENEDAYGLRLFAEQLPEIVVASSCSKNFGLYRERVGAVSIMTETKQAAAVAKSHILSIARGNWSMPPSHGAAIVETILLDDKLTSTWSTELSAMRQRINTFRSLFANRLQEKSPAADFSFIENEKGMFSFLGLSKEQVQRLIQKYSIYMVDSSRINVAGINHCNIDYLVDAIGDVLNNA